MTRSIRSTFLWSSPNATWIWKLDLSLQISSIFIAINEIRDRLKIDSILGIKRFLRKYRKQTARKLSEILMQSCRRNPEIVQKLVVFVLNDTIFVLNLVAGWGSDLTDLS